MDEQQNVRVDRERLDRMMKLRGVDNQKLADEIGKTYASIIYIKSNQTTALATLADICRVLQCHPFDLIVAEGYPEPFLAAPVSL